VTDSPVRDMSMLHRSARPCLAALCLTAVGCADVWPTSPAESGPTGSAVAHTASTPDASASPTAPATPGGSLSYNRDIRPILSDNCFLCHGPDERMRDQTGGLRLDVREEALAFEAILPGDPDASPLIQRILSTNTNTVMPPPETHRRVTAEEAALLAQWIEEGAEYEPHWAFIPPAKPELPEVSDPDWCRNDIDRFVLARLDREGLSPSSEADRRTLIRRVSLDLTGLPPTPEEVEAFVTDESPEAYEKVVDRLLASPHYGERMALPWLDAARYADSNSYQFDDNRFAWPWRDWLIRTLNDNRPFDDAIIEMLAGDLLPEPTLDQRVATAFNRNHFINGEGGAIAEEVRFSYVLDRVETTSTTFLGMTFACAQCHDHKYDPVSHENYYQFFAFFGQTDEDGRTQRNVETWDFRYRMANPMVSLATDAQRQELARLRAAEGAAHDAAKPYIGSLNRDAAAWAASLSGEEMEALPALMHEIVLRSRYREGFPLPQMQRKLNDYYATHAAPIEAEWRPFYFAWIEAVKARMAHEETMPWVMTMDDRAQPRDIRVRSRGQYNQPIGEPVQPGLPDALGGLPDGLPRNRLGLARWMVSDANPLTARVLVNRQWQLFFATGLVKTPEDFGLQGALPSHPGLLDYLAACYQDGWDNKALVRLIVTSTTYRQSSRITPALLERDPDNELLARGPRFRLPAMLLRDQALRAAGLLNDELFGPPVYPYQPEGLWVEVSYGQFEYHPSTGDDLYRRTLYTFFRRTIAPPNLFDNANRQACSVNPSLTNTPLHALTTLNDPTFIEAARGLAMRAIEQQPDAEPRAVIAEMCAIVLLRPAEARELDILAAAYQREHARYAADPDAASAYLAIGELTVPDDLDRAHLAALASVGLTILNLDEALTKE